MDNSTGKVVGCMTEEPLGSLGAGAALADDLAWLDAYNVVWTTPSANAGESMPVGGHDIGLNVWVETGDVLFYISQAGCRDENGALLKHGRVRLQLSPNPFAEGGAFLQELKLRESCVQISGTGRDGASATVRVWVEVERPVVHVEVDSEQPVETAVTFETWRYCDRELPQAGGKMGPRSMAMMNRDGYPGKVWLYADTVQGEPEQVLWYHRMRNAEGVFEESVRRQHLEAVRDELYDPLTDLTFGGMLQGDNHAFSGETEGVYAQTSFRGWRYTSSTPAKQHRVRMLCHIDQTDSVVTWERRLRELAAAEQPAHHEAWKCNLDWWARFWRRSHIVISPCETRNSKPSPAWQVGRNYNLFRFMLACNLSGREPTMFNGGLFTFDPVFVEDSPAALAGENCEDQGWTPDHRQWGAGFTAQNQRLMYWPMLRSGDSDIMQPGLDFYRRGLASAKARVKEYWGHEGACFVEQISAQALPGLCMWGWDEGGPRGRPEDLEPGVQVNGATRYLYQAQLEFACMALHYHRYFNGDIGPYLPFIDAAVRFYDQHYRMRKQQRDGSELDEHGHIVITPSHACESYQEGVVNPADAVAGLQAVLDGLLDLDDELLSAEQKADYRGMQSRVPPVPTMEREGVRVLAPAESWEDVHPKEIPELYPLFPYDRYGLGRDEFEMAQDTWKHTPGDTHAHISWHQGGIFSARLGLTDVAADFAIKKLGDSDRRFPTFGGPGHDWVPDHNWGGSGMIGLQEMLLQTHGREIWLLPAWPKDWDVDFKLHAPYRTTVEGRVKDGKLVELKVTPESRQKDVEVMGGFSPCQYRNAI